MTDISMDWSEALRLSRESTVKLEARAACMKAWLAGYWEAAALLGADVPAPDGPQGEINDFLDSLEPSAKGFTLEMIGAHYPMLCMGDELDTDHPPSE